MIGVDVAAAEVADGVHAAGAGDDVPTAGVGDGVHAAGAGAVDGAPAVAVTAMSRHHQRTHRLVHAIHLATPELGIIISRQITLIKFWPN